MIYIDPPGTLAYQLEEVRLRFRELWFAILEVLEDGVRRWILR